MMSLMAMPTSVPPFQQINVNFLNQRINIHLLGQHLSITL